MKSKSLDCCPLDPTRAKGLTMIDVLLDREGAQPMSGLEIGGFSDPLPLTLQ